MGVIRVCAVCDAGFGFGPALRRRIEEALEDQGVRYDLEVVGDVGAVSAAGNREADLVLATDELARSLAGIAGGNARLVGLQNFTDRSEVREKVSGALSGMPA